MSGHIYIKRKEATAIYKTNDYYGIYYALLNRGYNHEDAEDIASWAELSAIGDEYDTSCRDEITVGE